jgi:hypothetical protein
MKRTGRGGGEDGRKKTKLIYYLGFETSMGNFAHFIIIFRYRFWVDVKNLNNGEEVFRPISGFAVFLPPGS